MDVGEESDHHAQTLVFAQPHPADLVAKGASRDVGEEVNHHAQTLVLAHPHPADLVANY